jgi:hypothetical protein
MNSGFIYGVKHNTNEFILPKTPARPCVKIRVVDVARNFGLRVFLFQAVVYTRQRQHREGTAQSSILIVGLEPTI